MGKTPTLTLSISAAAGCAANAAAKTKVATMLRAEFIRVAIALLLLSQSAPNKQTSCRLFPHVHDGDHRPAALRSLMHGVDRHENRRIADRGGGNAADGGFGMAVVMHI